MVEVEVTFDYVAEQPDELTIKVGDVIKNVIQSEGGWWEGELKGKKGMFPDNFVKVVQKDVKKDEKEEVKMRENKKDVQATKRQSVRDLANKIKDKVHDGPVPVRKKVSAKKRAKVVFAYEPENEDELRLSVGDMVDVLKQEEEGWWEGVVNGKQGMLPSNFVEIVDESEPSLPEVTEKNEPNEGEGNLIKGKKIQGIGLGNIFGDGPIKLRPTAGKKPGDKPTEPTKVERPPQEPFERRPKDARLNTNNCANPSLAVDPSPILLHLNPLTEHQIDELYTDKTDNLDYKNNNIAAFQGKPRNCSLKQAAVTSFSLKSDDDMPVEIVDNLQDLDIEDLRMIENMYEDEDETIDTFDNIVKVPHVELNASNSSFKHESQNESNYKDQSMSNMSSVNGKYSDSLHTILDDLDNCLEMSSRIEKKEKAIIFNDNVDIKEWSSPEPEASTLCLIYDKDDSYYAMESSSEISDKAVNDDINEIRGTPKSNTNFNAVVDSVLVTKRRISSGSYQPGVYRPGEINLPYSQSTPISNKRYDSSFVTPQSTNRYTHMPELPSLRDPPRTNFASLNRSGTTSPFIQSIAHKYHIFNTPVPPHNPGEIQKDRHQDDESGLAHKATDGDLPDQSGLAQEITDDDDVDETPVTVEMDQDQATTGDVAVTDTQTQGDIQHMVNAYMYDVLQSAYPSNDKTDKHALFTESEYDNVGSLMALIHKDDSCSTSIISESEALNNASLDGCVDENSVRLDESVSKESLTANLPSKIELIDRGIGVYDTQSYFMMMIGDDGSLSESGNDEQCCKDLSVSVDSVDEISDKEKGTLGQYQSKTLTNAEKGLNKIFSDICLTNRSPQNRSTRKTSSFCRIPFDNKTPSFWFKKDFTESPCKEALPVCNKARSPKRPIGDIRDKVPSLFMLAERAYMDDFRGKVEAFKEENPHLLLKTKHSTPVNLDEGRSPARKKRKKTDILYDLETESTPNINTNARKAHDFTPYEANAVSQTDTPPFVGFQPASQLLLNQQKSLDLIEKEQLTPEKSAGKPNNTSVNEDASHQVPLVVRTQADYLLVTGTSEDNVRFAIDCSEKRKKRFFRLKSKSKEEKSPVKLLSFRKLEGNESGTDNNTANTELQTQRNLGQDSLNMSTNNNIDTSTADETMWSNASYMADSSYMAELTDDMQGNINNSNISVQDDQDRLADITPDPETLQTDLQNLDLSGTPPYAADTRDIKLSLREALDTLDDLVLDSSPIQSTLFNRSPVIGLTWSLKNGMMPESPLCDIMQDDESPVCNQSMEHKQVQTDDIVVKDGTSLTTMSTVCTVLDESMEDSQDSLNVQTDIFVKDGSMGNGQDSQKVGTDDIFVKDGSMGNGQDSQKVGTDDIFVKDGSMGNGQDSQKVGTDDIFVKDGSMGNGQDSQKVGTDDIFVNDGSMGDGQDSIKADFTDDTIEVDDDSILRVVGIQCKLYDNEATDISNVHPKGGTSDDEITYPTSDDDLPLPFMFRMNQQKYTNAHKPGSRAADEKVDDSHILAVIESREIPNTIDLVEDIHVDVEEVPESPNNTSSPSSPLMYQGIDLAAHVKMLDSWCSETSYDDKQLEQKFSPSLDGPKISTFKPESQELSEGNSGDMEPLLEASTEDFVVDASPECNVTPTVLQSRRNLSSNSPWDDIFNDSNKENMTPI